jgi:murein DD-endopeptidase MepM/ murein hydrolase activator NlpD
MWTPGPNLETADGPREAAGPARVVALCSPLEVAPWEDLWKIDWQPFVMPMHYEGTKFRDNGHPGVDLVYYSRYGREGIVGEGVQAVLDGKIASVVKNRMPYGNMVMTETVFDQLPSELLTLVPIPPGHSLYLVHAHLRDLAEVSLGQTVECGKHLGHVGNTGMSTGTHLHFEARWGPAGAQFPAMSYYTADHTDEEMDNYILWRMSGDYIPFDPMILLTLDRQAAADEEIPGSSQ